MSREGMERFAGLWLVGLLGTIGAPSGAAQEMALAERGPRFLLASANGTSRPVEIEVGSNMLLRQVVGLNLVRPTVGRLLDEITGQTGLTFFYGEDVLSPDRPVTLQADSITVATALVGILMDARVDVLLTRGKQVALVKRRRARAAPAQQGTIVGRVTDAETGQGLEAAEVLLAGTRFRVLTDVDGRYRIAEVDTGNYTVMARRIGYAQRNQAVTVVADQEVTVDLTLQAVATQLEELVTVTPGGLQTQAKAVPSPITVITARDLEAQRPQMVRDVIRQAVPSAVAFDFPNSPVETAVSVRGVSSLGPGGSTIKILIDGVEASRRGATPVDPSSIDRIEVIRGPQASTVYGADAAGGVIQIFTKRGDSGLARPMVEVQGEAGIAQTPYEGFGGVGRQRYTASAQGGGAEVTYNFGAGYTRLSDWIPGGASSRQSSPSVYGGMRYTRGGVVADLHARHMRNNWNPGTNPEVFAAGFIPLSRPSFIEQDQVNETYGARIAVAPTSWWQNQLTLGADRNNVDLAQTQRRLTTPADTLFVLVTNQDQRNSLLYNTSVTGEMSTALAGSLTAGIDHYRADTRQSFTGQALNTEGTIQTSPPGAFSENRAIITNTGYFGQVELNWLERVYLTAGLRAEENSTFGDDLGTPVLPRVGVSVVHQIGQTTAKVRAAYGRAIRAPRPGQAFGVILPTSVQLANPLLAPERQRGWDAGIDLVFGSRAALSVSRYDQVAEDLIAQLPIASMPALTFQFQNVGEVVNRGVEVEGSVDLGRWQIKGQYGYVHSQVRTLGPDVAAGAQVEVGDRPLEVPTHTAGASLTVNPWSGATLNTGVSYVGGFRQVDFLAQFRCFGGTGPCRPTPRDYVIEFPDFAKINLAFTQRLTEQVDGFVSIDNLTNSSAFEGNNLLPVIGRMTMAGLRARL